MRFSPALVGAVAKHHLSAVRLRPEWPAQSPLLENHMRMPASRQLIVNDLSPCIGNVSRERERGHNGTISRELTSDAD
jgi:hypothetical protein